MKQNQLVRVIKHKINPTLIIQTFLIVNQIKTIDFEIRTTFTENILIPRDIHKIISFLKENNFRGSYVLQQYQYSEGVGKEFKNTFHKPSHLALLKILKSYKDLNLPFEIYLRDDIIGYGNLREIYRKID